MKKLSILFLADGIHPFTIGGMQTHSSELVKNFVRAGHEVTLLFSVNSGCIVPDVVKISNELKLNEEEMTRFDCRGFEFPKNFKLPGHYIRESYTLSTLFFRFIESKLNRFDFIFAQGFTAWKFLEMKEKRSDMPLTGVHFHGLNMFQKTHGFKARLTALMFRSSVSEIIRMADVVFSYGGIFNSILKKIHPDVNCVFQPIGIDTEKIHSVVKPCQSPLQFVFIGRNDKVKGLNILHQTISKIKSDKMYFTFIGDIPENIRLKQPNCRYTGIISDDDKNEILASSDILLCTSYSEGMPYVILEAMAHGLMILSSNVGAISELVSDKNAILIPPAQPQLLFQALQNIAAMYPNEINDFKKASLENAHRFEWNKIMNDLTEQIQLILQNKPGITKFD